MRIIIGLTGRTGSGKDAVCDYIRQRVLNSEFLRFSQPLSEALSLFVDRIKKEDQQWLGSTLRDRFGQDILSKAIEKKISKFDGGLIVLNGIRYESEYDLLKRIGGKLVYVVADQKTRWERVGKRAEKADDQSGFEKFLEMEKAVTEAAIDGIGKRADFFIDNNGSYMDLYGQINKIFECLKIPTKENS
ncbi:MAG TPA: AAA family ATPase [Candidatus Pacearchaeota archaeon]|nr:AAA family ATPase [Candidatus Pacearchaeota archaeon]